MPRSCRVHVALVPYGAERPGRSIAEIDLSSIVELASVEAVQKIVQGLDQVPGGLVVVVPLASQPPGVVSRPAPGSAAGQFRGSADSAAGRLRD